MTNCSTLVSPSPGDEGSAGFLGLGRERAGRFTYRALRALRVARDEAIADDEEAVQTGHLLLGVLELEEGVGAIALRNLGVDPAMLRPLLRKRTGTEAEAGRGAVNVLSSTATEALDNALTEAQQLGHEHVGTEHILLGLIAGPANPAADALRTFGLDQARARAEVLSVLASWSPGTMRPRRSGED